jgi:hypothetical protein
MANKKPAPGSISQTSTSGNNTYTSGSNNNVNVGNTLGTPDQRQALEDLLAQLQQASANNPEADMVVLSAKEAVKEATSKEAKPEEVKTRTQMLQLAAEQIKTLLPPVFQIATSLIASIVALRS